MKDWFSQFGGNPIKHQEEPSSDWFSNFGGKSIDKNLSDKSSRGIGESVLRQAGRLGRAAATGVAGIADIPNLGALGLHAAGLKEKPTFYEPIAGKVQQGIDTLTGGSLKPENKAEEYVDIIGEGLAPMLLSPFTGGASLTSTAARGLSKTGTKGAEKLAKIGATSYKPTASNIAANVGSSASLKAYIDEGGDPNFIGTLLASGAGGIGGRNILSASKNIHKIKNPLNLSAEIIGRTTKFNPETYAKHAELGIPVSIASVSDRPITFDIERIAAKTPGSMEPLRDFHNKQEAAIARNLGVRFPENLEATVKDIPIHLAKKGAHGYHTRAENIYKGRQNKFLPRELEAISNKELVDVSDIVKELEKNRSKHSTEEIAKKMFDPSGEGILLKNIKSADPKKDALILYNNLKSQGIGEKHIQEIVKKEFGDIDLSNSDKNEIGYYTLNKLREKALKESEKARMPTGAGTIESREAAIRSEMLGKRRHQFIEETGTSSQIHNSRQARNFWSRYKDTKKDNEKGMAEYVAKITGADNDTAAFRKLVSDNPKYLRIARQGLSREERPKLASSIIESLGDVQDRFNINTAHTRISKMSDSSRKELLRTFPNKAAQNNFEGTMDVIGKNKRLMEWLSNTSNTAHTNQMIKFIEKYGSASASALGAVIGYSTGSIIPLALLAASYAGSKYGAKIWTNQNFLRRMNDVMSTTNIKGKANKLDSLVSYIENIGIHTKDFNKTDSDKEE